eukprot:12762479-Alexandrium_andersonii.AAC.1
MLPQVSFWGPEAVNMPEGPPCHLHEKVVLWPGRQAEATKSHQVPRAVIAEVLLGSWGQDPGKLLNGVDDGNECLDACRVGFS